RVPPLRPRGIRRRGAGDRTDGVHVDQRPPRRVHRTRARRAVPPRARGRTPRGGGRPPPRGARRARGPPRSAPRCMVRADGLVWEVVVGGRPGVTEPGAIGRAGTPTTG